MDYANGKIYKLECEDGHFYIGSTATELRKRLSRHKKDTIKRIGTKVYSHISQLGWNKVKIVLIEDFPCENKKQLVMKEDTIIRNHLTDPLCLNTTAAYRTTEQRQEYLKRYNELHKVKLSEQRNQYRIANKDKFAEYNRNYRRRLLEKEMSQ